MLMKHPDDNKIYKSDDSINWTLATVEDVYETLTKKEKECKKLKKKLDISIDALEEIAFNYTEGDEIGCVLIVAHDTIKQLEDFNSMD